MLTCVRRLPRSASHADVFLSFQYQYWLCSHSKYYKVLNDVGLGDICIHLILTISYFLMTSMHPSVCGYKERTSEIPTVERIYFRSQLASSESKNECIDSDEVSRESTGYDQIHSTVGITLIHSS